METVNLFLNIVLVALLGAVIYFVIRLRKQLDVVRSGKQQMEVLLQDLVVATTSAQQSLTGLRGRAEDLAETLGKQVKGAENAREELSFLLASADRSAADLVKLVEGAKQTISNAPLASALPRMAAPASAPDPAAAQTPPVAANTQSADSEAHPKPELRRQAEADLLKAIEKLR